MPRNTATPSLENRITRGMDRAMPLKKVRNTTTASKQVKAGPSTPARSTISEPRRKAVDDWRRDVVTHTETAQTVSSTSHAGPHRGLAPPPRLSFRTGDLVVVYASDNNGGRIWCTGEVAHLKRCHGPKLTDAGTYEYPVMLDNRQPRVTQWFDESLGHIYHQRS
ncbi:hypothetical protein VTO73DRAFT_8119 [Trametes versicolor]